MTPELSLFSNLEPDETSTATPPDSAVPRELALLALGNINGVGHSTAVKIYDTGHFAGIFSASYDEVHWIAGLAHVPSPHAFAESFVSQRASALEAAEVDLRGYAAAGISIVFDDSVQFPSKLLQFVDHPRWLFVRGSVDLLSDPRLITVVGTRQPSDGGRRLAERVTQILVRQGFAPVSGLAEGIDEIVHKSCVEHKGQTVAVLGTGISNDFPASTSYLRNHLLRLGGAIITEFFDKEQYSKQRFVQRNRIQAALSSVTIPVEAGVPSGTLHTVRFAEKYGRTLLGVKWDADEFTPLHELLIAGGADVVPVPASDDPFLEAIARSYDYSDFARISDLRRRNAVIEKAVKYIRNLIRTEKLSDHEAERMFKDMRSQG